MANSHATPRLEHHDPTVRLQAALAAGIDRNGVPATALIERCAVEPDFFVRDMLTWALTRRPADVVVPRLLDELAAAQPQARSQALHTLSKIRDGRAWPRVLALMGDPDDEVARSAWRAAVALVPAGREDELARELIRHLGRGDGELQRSLSRALIALGDAAVPELARAARTGALPARAHALATEQLMRDPDSDFAPALREATRLAVLGRGPIPGTAC